MYICKKIETKTAMTFKDFTSLQKISEHFHELIIHKKTFLPKDVEASELPAYFETKIEFAIQMYKPTINKKFIFSLRNAF